MSTKDIPSDALSQVRKELQEVAESGGILVPPEALGSLESFEIFLKQVSGG